VPIRVIKLEGKDLSFDFNIYGAEEKDSLDAEIKIDGEFKHGDFINFMKELLLENKNYYDYDKTWEITIKLVAKKKVQTTISQYIEGGNRNE